MAFHLKMVLSQLDGVISCVKNIEEVKSVILQKNAGSTKLEGETEVINEGGGLQPRIIASYVKISNLLAKKTAQHNENLRNFVKDVVIAYIRNCVEHHVGNVPENFFQVGEHNIRHKINRIIALGNRLVAENPENVDKFRRQCAGFLHLLTFPGAQLSYLQKDMLSRYFRWWDCNHDVNNWDRFMVKLMIITHIVCTCIKRDGYTVETKAWIDKRIQEFLDLCYRPPYDKFFKDPCNWQDVKFRKDLNPQVKTLNIPVVPASAIDIDDMEMRQEALEAFKPLPSNGFMGACPVPAPRLDNLACSGLL